MKRKRNTNTPLTNFLGKRILCKTKHQLQYDISYYVVFRIQGIWYDLSMIRISFKLTKTVLKTEKIVNSLKMYDLINFKPIRYRLTTLSNTIYSIIKYKLWDRSAFYGCLKNKKDMQKKQIQKEWARKVSNSLTSDFFSKKFSIYTHMLAITGFLNDTNTKN